MGIPFPPKIGPCRGYPLTGIEIKKKSLFEIGYIRNFERMFICVALSADHKRMVLSFYAHAKSGLINNTR